MQAGFAAYSQAVRHHSSMIYDLRKQVDELKFSNKELKEANVKMSSEITHLKQNQGDMQNLATAIDNLEKRVKDMEENREAQPVKSTPVSEHQKTDARAERTQLTEDQKETIDQDLVQAAASGSSEDVQVLLGRGANVECRDNNKTPLWAAAWDGHAEVVNILLNWGASINARGGQFAGTALMSAAQRGHRATLEMLIVHGAAINVRDCNQSTALTLAAAMGHSEVCEVLISQGAYLDSQDKWGNTSLIVASVWKQVATVELLSRSGASLNLKNNRGYTALSSAKQARQEDIVRCLLNAGH